MTLRALSLSLAVLVTASTHAAACSLEQDGGVDIYPTAETLPENLLRMYIYFPRSMAADEGLRNVRLLDDQGSLINDVFLVSGQELWSPDRTRLTLLLDPGRVKSGLVAHELMGRALVPGQSYTLAVSGAALDEQGCALGSDTHHSFSVAGPDFETPDPAKWELNEPRLGSTDAVRIDLGSTHDHLSLAYGLRVVDSALQLVPGAISLGPDEASWSFTPRQPWGPERYEVVVDERLEDLAGNRPGILFDRPMNTMPTDWMEGISFTPTALPN